jgi:hypothetical protein
MANVLTGKWSAEFKATLKGMLAGGFISILLYRFFCSLVAG